MRSDMYKVIVERPRSGSWRPNGSVGQCRREARGRDPEVLEALASTLGMKPRQRYSRRYLNENLSPLRRFLMGNVGRRWEDVYSDLRAHLSPRNAVQMHVCQHLEDYVALHVRIDGRKVYRMTTRWSGDRPLRDDGRTFYVDPVTRRLCRPTWRGEVVQPTKPDVPASQKLFGGRLAVAIHGAWFVVDTEPLRATDVPGWDVVFRAVAGAPNREQRRALYGNDRVYGARKRQLSKTECRRAGIA
jgi:hypothetical protein